MCLNGREFLGWLVKQFSRGQMSCSHDNQLFAYNSYFFEMRVSFLLNFNSYNSAFVLLSYNVLRSRWLIHTLARNDIQFIRFCLGLWVQILLILSMEFFTFLCVTTPHSFWQDGTTWFQTLWCVVLSFWALLAYTTAPCGFWWNW